jgi:TrmH family RNA methyltransferase
VLTKNQIKQINNLQKKKFRDQLGLFSAEGNKLVSELLDAGMEASMLIFTSNWTNPQKSKYLKKAEQIIETEPAALKKVSNLKTPPSVIGIFKIPTPSYSKEDISNSLSILLDDLQDPGNLGTIIRIADWFGIKHIFCSPNTVDTYNPKVIQATMGAISRVNVHYTDLNQLISKFQQENFPVYGTFLDGENLYEQKLSSKGFIIMGNEGKGISSDLEKMVSQKLLIPNYPQDAPTSESLNVSVATAIICGEFRRQFF